MNSSLRLFGYWRSSAAYRVRIALNLKGLAYESVPVHLVKNGGEQRTDAFLLLNPQGLVPVLQDGETTVHQSLAIIEYLDECYPSPALLPKEPASRARVRALAMDIACDLHPLNNLRVLQYLENELGQLEPARLAWVVHWVEMGLAGLEAQLSASSSTGDFCHGDQPSLADCCLIPQLYNARRFNVDLMPYPTLLAIEAKCLQLVAFSGASPDKQADAP